MPVDVYMVVTDQNGTVIPSESSLSVADPYLKQTVKQPFELRGYDFDTENTFTFSTTGGGAGKVVFNPFVVDRLVDVLSPVAFIAQATGLVWKAVDILVVRATSDAAVRRPFLSYRLGTVAVSDISSTMDEESPTERLSFTYGQLQIGYQQLKPDGTQTPFQPVGWDRIHNVRI